MNEPRSRTAPAPGGTATRPARTALWVPVLVVLGVAGIIAHDAAEKAHLKAEWAHCGDLPLTWQMYASAYGALACGLGAIALLVLLALRGERHGSTPLRGWRGGVALAFALLGVLPLLAEAIIVWHLYQPAPGGTISCV
ncbi:hypothetical protein AB0B79_32790 [Streptomyces sp. NPDC039022]|uniref:hypothetical protein n=1 Tax=Streptomyces sp. NPDC039022 TaxID=3157091 RepID=UPI0033C7DF4D